MRSKVKYLVVLGLVMIITGLIFQCADLVKKIEDLESKYDSLVTEYLKVTYENEALWNNYYDNVSDYNGEYEYYE